MRLGDPNPALPMFKVKNQNRGLNGEPNTALAEIGGICTPCQIGSMDGECLNYADYGLYCGENLR